MKSNYGILKVVWLLSFMLVPITHTANGSDSTITLDHELQASIQKLHPKAEIISLEDINLSECSPKRHPGLVKADFNGDGNIDYAVLLKIGDAKDIKEWEGKFWRKIETWFVVFLGDAQGKFKSKVIERLDEYFPTIIYIDIQIPETIREFDSKRIVILKNYGIIRYFCGKSATVFYWDNKKSNFQHIWVSD